MKNFTKLLSLLVATLLLPAAMWANVIVKGNVKYLNGAPAANYQVNILTDSTLSNSCFVSHTRFTNASGAYQDTLVCNSFIPSVIIYVRDCNNNLITRTVQVSTSGIVESNFTVCQNNQCSAEFNWQANGLAVSFTSANSSAGSGQATIIKRTWTFGDGTAENGNVVSPVHTYPGYGTYTVCLKIKTSDSCESNVCKTVILAPPTQCQANFTISLVTASPRKFKFNSNVSAVSTGDSIISRKWKFGDGDSLVGNEIDPTHEYATPGNYTVCLYIKTRLGCESFVCKPLSVVVNSVCHAAFAVNPVANATSPYVMHFNGWISTTGAGDSLYQFLWKFGDGTTATTGDPNHTYAAPGTYNVCLRITSRTGCVDSICRPVVVALLQRCKAAFTFTLTPSSTVNGLPVVARFYSSNSFAPQGDSIIARKWSFGDGVSVTGNAVNTDHAYTSAGTYNACLYILTASGCRDTLCATLVVPPANTNTGCEPRFTFTSSGQVLHFNSITSTATAGDSIIARLWTFGDGTSATTIDPVHAYAQAGRYLVCLRITSRLGCVKTKCDSIVVVNPIGNCAARFTTQIPAPRIAVFNSSTSNATQFTDSIVSRKWTFGDGQSILAGNVVSPTHQYAFGGTYNVCLQIRTRLGCESRWCTNVFVGGDTANNDPIRIISLYPNPVYSPLNAVIWSRNSNVNATLAIYDVYGVVKYSMTKVLPLGTSTTQMPTASLAPGPYIFKITTMFGTQSRNFFKL